VCTALIQDQDGVLFLVPITGKTYMRNLFYGNQAKLVQFQLLHL